LALFVHRFAILYHCEYQDEQNLFLHRNRALQTNVDQATLGNGIPIIPSIIFADRQKLDALLSLRLKEFARKRRPLETVMSDISQKAQARGLTPEILSNLLSE
jgi:hypothetical protein